MRRGYSLLQRLVVAIVKPALLLLTRRDWRGRQHVPRTGGMILAANHLSWTDPLAISHFLHESGRWPVFLAKSELFDVPVLGKLVALLGQLPVYRRRTDAGLALRAAENALQEGACVVFYPEGTCTRDPRLWPMVGKTGAARLALTTGVPVIPLAHWGPHELLPYGEKKPRLFPRKVMRLAAGPPVDLSAYQPGELSGSNLRGATDEISKAITLLLAELRGEEPPPGPYDPRARRYGAEDSPPAPLDGGSGSADQASQGADSAAGRPERAAATSTGASTDGAAAPGPGSPDEAAEESSGDRGRERA